MSGAEVLVDDRAPGLGQYDGAWVTPLRRPSDLEFSGEVYTRDLQLVQGSIRPSSAAAYQHVPRPPAAEELTDAPTLPGTYLFVGHHFEIFGHDLLEFATRLWPLLDDVDVDGVVVLRWKPRSRRPAASTSPAADALTAVGFQGKVVEVTDAPVRVERLLVPDPAFHINDHCLTICRDVFQLLGDAQRPDHGARPEPHRRVFLSRARLKVPSRFAHEQLLENVAAEQGYEVVHPEQLPFAEQVRLMQESVAVAGLDGSAMHLAVFARPGTKLTCFDTRYVRNQYVLEALMGLSGRHVDLGPLQDAGPRVVEQKIRGELAADTGGSTRAMAPKKSDPAHLDSSRRINAFAEKLGARRYLEIGVARGFTFTNVTIPERDGVDPEFRFDHASVRSDLVRCHQMTSDRFFTEVAHGTYDIIFIDGLHTFEQTFRDFCASLSFAHSGTLWIIDDTMPNDIFSAHPDAHTAITTRREHGTDTMDWHGDVYRVVPAIHDFFPQFSYVTPTSGRNPQTLVWLEPRTGFAPVYDSLEKIERLDYYDFLKIRDLFNCVEDDDAVMDRVLAGLSRAGRPPAGRSRSRWFGMGSR